MFFRRASMIAALLFFFSATLQYNDPDPIQWMAMYLAAAVVSALAAGRRAPPWWAPVLVGAVALGWALGIAPHALGKAPLGRMFESWEMKNVAVEENRETFGLLIVAAWMALVTFMGVRRRPEGTSRS